MKDLCSAGMFSSFLERMLHEAEAEMKAPGHNGDVRAA
jgi:hypothetical protein